jgi:quinoprotein glucose dehydrogenase
MAWSICATAWGRRRRAPFHHLAGNGAEGPDHPEWMGYDNQSVQEPSGVVRAFDARSGKLVWSWDVGRKPTNKPLGSGETFTRGTPNAWGVYTADPALGLIYVPTGIATPDYFGGKRRPFDDVYNSSLVALDIETGLER